MKAEWSSAMEKSGELCVMTSGAHLTHKLFVDSLASIPQARRLSTLPSLDRELAPSGLMMWSVLELRPD